MKARDGHLEKKPKVICNTNMASKSNFLILNRLPKYITIVMHTNHMDPLETTNIYGYDNIMVDIASWTARVKQIFRFTSPYLKNAIYFSFLLHFPSYPSM